MVKTLLKKKWQLAITTKNLINKGVPTRQIMRELKVNKQYVSYWRHHDVENTHYRKKKLPLKYIKWLVEVAQNRPVSECSSRIMARIINKKFKKDKIKDYEGRQLTIRYRTINNILNKFVGKPKKIRQVFFLSNEQKKKEWHFVKWY